MLHDVTLVVNMLRKKHRQLYGGADKSLARTEGVTSSAACQGRARFQQYRDASCHQFFFL